jgi:FkbM family methyltransferase
LYLIHNFISFTFPRIKFLLKKQKNYKEIITFFFRLIFLCLIIYFRKKYFFYGYFGKNKFKVILETLKQGFGTRGYYLLRNRQEPILEFGYKLINKNDVVIDGGANQGIFSLSFRSAIKEGGLIIAVEPFKYAAEKLKKNFLLNNYKNFIIYQRALSDKNKKNKIYYSNTITDASIVNKKQNYRIIESITIDKIIKLNNLKKLNLIKLDIEGAEYLALKGAMNSLKKFKPIIYLEISNFINFNKIKTLLNKLNYNSYIFNSKGRLVNYKKYNSKQQNIIFKFNKKKL